MANENQMWGIHGGRTGDANTLFLKEGCVALGWHKVGDLSKLAPNREAFKAELASKFPDKKAGAIPVEAGQLFRFAHEARVGDIVIYPSKADRHIHVGRISGNYFYNDEGKTTYPHRRPVEWLKGQMVA
ncbi:putative Mrr-cat superfamily restriction endonuclease [Bradyrhizobium sp. i1.8.4]|uniref:restriction endonuclease n=1 Tax=unclassified Bradyrhizobium TaxID=2631580 RepID=UPI003D1EE132